MLPFVLFYEVVERDGPPGHIQKPCLSYPHWRNSLPLEFLQDSSGYAFVKPEAALMCIQSILVITSSYPEHVLLHHGYCLEDALGKFLPLS